VPDINDLVTVFCLIAQLVLIVFPDGCTTSRLKDVSDWVARTIPIAAVPLPQAVSSKMVLTSLTQTQNWAWLVAVL